MKMGFTLAEKCLPQKGGNFQTGEQGWGPLFPASEGAITCPGMTSALVPDTVTPA